MIIWPIILYFVLVVGLVAVMIGLSYLLGERHMEPSTGLPYEGGIVSQGSASVRFPAKYYLVAMFFVVFDLESVFIFAWAIVGKEVGWAGYIEVVIFIGVLVASLIYLWRIGALDWGSTKREPRIGRR
ncbi:MAG: NADH-quinone oxidoreductase subunit A [Terriglobia bacterium]